LLLFSTTFAKDDTSKENPDLPRVLIIGDSISIGYTGPVRKFLKGKANVLRPNGNCQHTATGLKRIKKWLGTGKWDVIHFNWGIWDTHYIDKTNGKLVRSTEEGDKSSENFRIRHTPEQYRKNMIALLDILKDTNATLIWASTTPLMSRKGKRFEDIKNYNNIAEKLMKERKIMINDLYGFCLPHIKEWQGRDKCHFTALGSKKLGEKVGACILNALKQKKGQNKKQ
jgi:hypothetical protein